MVKQHLDELDYRIQEMMAFRQALVRRYEQIDALLPNSATVTDEPPFNGKICGLIEWEDGDTT